MKKKNILKLFSIGVPFLSLVPLVASCGNTGAKDKTSDNNENSENSENNNSTSNSSYNDLSIEQLKELATDELNYLRDKKNFASLISKENDKEKLIELVQEIKEALASQPKLTGAEASANDAEFTKLVESATSTSLFDFVPTSAGFHKSKSDSLPSEVMENSSDWKLKILPEYASKVRAELTNIQYPENSKNIANERGELKIFVRFSNPNTNLEPITRHFILGGFKQGSTGEIQVDPSTPVQNELREYLSKDQLNRYKYDNDKFVELATRRDGNNWKVLRNGQLTNTTDSQVNTFNTKASEVGVSSYTDSVYKNFGVPKYGENGQVEGIVMPSNDLGNLPSWVDSYGKKNPFRATGLGRILPNQKYVDIAKQSFAISFSSYLASSNESERNQIKQLLQNKEDLNDLINELQSDEKKEFFKKRLGDGRTPGDRPDASWREKVKMEVWEELIKENGGDQEKAAVIYTKYINKYRNEMEKAVQASTLPELVKQRVISKIKSESDLDELALFGNQQSNIRGTMWIMDYEIKDGEEYPTKFYFGTNLHVADAMIPDLFTTFSIARMKNEVNPVLNKLKFVGLDDNFEQFFMNSASIKRVFDGRDYLTKKPADFLANSQKETYKDAEEFIDFAVLEIDFSKTPLSQNSNASHPFNNVADFAKYVTNDYKNWDDNKKAKFLSESYLKNYSKIDFPLALTAEQAKTYDWNKLDQLYILGYPLANSGSWYDFYLEKYIDDDQEKVARYYNTIWVNGDQDFYNMQLGEDGPDANTKTKLERGNFLSYNIGYRTFIDKPGLTDAFLTAPVLGNKANPLDNLYTSTQDNKKYINFGLEYTPRWYAPGGGASGSSVRNQHNQLVGVYHASNTTARTGLAAAFRSEGYDYKNLYGEYNLPQYDLIYGNGKDQKNSYRDAMQKLSTEANSVKKTYLFQNGFDKNNIPSEFQFSSTLLDYASTKKVSGNN
ncbi:Ig-specific serine endopeptidase MIP [Mycoplasmopsis felifaucium]|uniref:DUF31 domain-containing protein n=1 Tax=Mycoplasmopsis felifaucium TaxID=35768 RepID=A0ABZ2RSA7_9BACT